MDVKALKCPQCGAALEIKDGLSTCYCMYCGTKLSVTDNKLEITINKNININKNIHKRYTNDADVIRAKHESHKDQQSLKHVLIIFGLLFFIILGIFVGIRLYDRAATREGKTSIGNSEDYIGENYHAVVAHFEAAGFENIELIDLDDSGLLFWKDGTVSQVSIEGKTYFESVNYFSLDSTVVITYH